jgi:hypothetical protein
MKINKKIKGFILLIFVLSCKLSAQLSPGALSEPHSNLEGISKCTQCHVLGDKVSNEKCLLCHTDIQSRINNKKGYHSSSEVNGKDCFTCHTEHNGKTFKLIRFDIGKFNHSLTGFSLSPPHAARQCQDCHNQKYITDQKIKTKKNTYLGLKNDCLSCHADYHQQTLSSSCLNCHIPESFKPASKFNHNNARFQLAGKHKTVECLKCHKKENINGKGFQEFRGVPFNNCTSCHKDPHQNQFGQNCRQCHNEESFNTPAKGLSNFDHNKTNFKLEEKHMNVSCTKCHRTKFTDPLKHDRCIDCHSDYHNGQFSKNGASSDCSQCHSVKGFNIFSFTVSQHNTGKFPLNGSHVAVPCFECHKKLEKWSFRGIGLDCADCHNDIHKTFIQTKYYPESNCRVCHNENLWTEVSFDHSKTGFSLTGSHIGQKCRVCHFKADPTGIAMQKFSGLSKNCTDCHKDNHYGQFEKNGLTICSDCHSTQNWKASGFDHSKTAFRLDGKHVNVLCSKCHKLQQEGEIMYVRYKLKEFKCESCH